MSLSILPRSRACLLICFVCTCLLSALQAKPMRYEAEDAAHAGLKIDRKTKGFSGTGYVSGFTNEAGSVEFTVIVPSRGLYTMTLGYATPHGKKQADLRINGGGADQIPLPEVAGFGEAPAGRALLEKGANTVTIERGWGWYEIDYLDVAPAPPRPPHGATATLRNPKADAGTRALMSFLVENFGSRMIAGQQEAVSSNYDDVDYIHQQTGKRPALLGLDFMDYSPSRVERGASSNQTEVAIQWWSERGGIVAFTWHWNAPAGLIDSPDKEWWRGFSTAASTFDLAAAMADRDSEAYALLLRDIDAIAEELKKLQKAGVPVLWRPLHEAEGGWFWWGAKGPNPCIQLWRLMFKRMTDHHQLNNLIWVWNSVAPEWYPGDDYVDIVSCDIYSSAHNYSPANTAYGALVSLSRNRKIIALAENGSIPDPDLAAASGSLWSWFCVWNGHFIREWNSVEHLRHVYHHPSVITLDDLPDLRTAASNLHPGN